jgi:uncharacterized membrane protein
MIPFSPYNIKKAVSVMRILLLNDNPVVRKLVALSAQKTKDDLSVVWSVDEIEYTAYDLVIVDDAYCSDEIMAALSEKITYKTNLLMATRGNAIPAGFDKVINKPFLPTDLVELFVNIEKSLPSATEPLLKEEEKVINVPTIELDTLMDDLDDSEDVLLGLEDDVDFDEEESSDLLDFETLDSLDDEMLEGTKTNILDHEEVQELQGLLEDTDTFDEDELSIEGLSLDDEEAAVFDTPTIEKMDDLSFDTLDENGFDDILLEGLDGLEMDDSTEDLKPEDELLDDALFDDLMMDDLKSEELDGLEELMPIEEDESLENLSLIEENDVPELESDLLSDDEFDDLEQQIQDAVGELNLDDLESTLEETDLEEFELDGLGSFDGVDELDGIDEREMKIAVGESVEEELSIRVGSGEHSSLDAEALSEAMGKSSKMELDDQDTLDTPVLAAQTEKKSPPSEGMEALQALLKALSNDEVAASLKGLNISININFGNEK